MAIPENTCPALCDLLASSLKLSKIHLSSGIFPLQLKTIQSQNLEGILRKKDKGGQENSNGKKKNHEALNKRVEPTSLFYPWDQQLVDSGGKRLLEQSIKSLKPLKY